MTSAPHAWRSPPQRVWRSASFVGLLTLIVAGAVPFIGPVVVAVAGILGSGALALLAVRAAIRPRVTTERTEPPRQPSDVGV